MPCRVRPQIGPLVCVLVLALGCSGDGDAASADPARPGGVGDGSRNGEATGGARGSTSGGSRGGSEAGGGSGDNGDGPAMGAASGNGGTPDGSGGMAGSQPVPDAAPPPMMEPMGKPVCDYPDWNRETEYQQGDIVMYQGMPYIAEHPNPGLDPIVSTYYWDPYDGCEPPPPPPATKCTALDRIFPEGEETFKAMFAAPFQGHMPNEVYSYSSLCKAMEHQALVGFAASGNGEVDKRELAAFFANVAIETAYLTYTDESGHKSSDGTFHGRGALQITGRSNYQAAGQALGINLAGQPQLGSTDGVVWQTGVWYWLRHANPSVGNPNICHDAIVNSDFGRTVRIIKGDCQSAGTRADQYMKNCALLGIDPGKTSCP